MRINTSAVYVTHVLAPILPTFFDRYPQVGIDLVQTDAVTDLLADRSDIAIRAGALASSGMIARSLGETPLVVVASPVWLKRYGEPHSLEELAAHGWIEFAYCRPLGDVLPRSETRGERIRVSDGEGVRQLALSGVAPARLAGFAIREDIVSGRLVPILQHRIAPVSEPFHAVYLGRSDTLPARVRVLIDFLAEAGRVDRAD